jgi:Ca2+-binding RTX toxin-like protein
VSGGGIEFQGTPGGDSQDGTDGADKLFGHGGNDELNGGAGADQVFGMTGNDTLSGGAGDGDYVDGGEGDDTLIWGPGQGYDVLNGQGGTDTLQLNGVNFDHFKAALAEYWLTNAGVTMNYDAHSNSLTFVNGAGQPVSFAAELNFNGQKIWFENIEKVQFA